MGQVTTLTSSDGHSFEVYEAAPDGNPMGTIVVVQEIFGVNAHIREVADCLLYTSPSPRDGLLSRMPSSA